MKKEKFVPHLFLLSQLRAPEAVSILIKWDRISTLQNLRLRKFEGEKNWTSWIFKLNQIIGDGVCWFEKGVLNGCVWGFFKWYFFWEKNFRWTLEIFIEAVLKYKHCNVVTTYIHFINCSVNMHVKQNYVLYLQALQNRHTIKSRRQISVNFGPVEECV